MDVANVTHPDRAAALAGARRDFALIDHLQGRWRFGYLLAGIWLVYLAEPLVAGWNHPSHLWGAVTVVSVVAFGAMYLNTWAIVRRLRHAGRTASTAWRTSRLVTAFVLGVVPCLFVGQHGLAAAPFLIVMMTLMLPPRAAFPLVGILMTVVVLLTELLPGWTLDGGLVIGLLLTAVVMWGMTQMIARNVQLAQSAELAVAQERARFARDLHDVLGHSLTLLAMKAELAGRLVRLDPDRAEAEIAGVERLARDALVDVRAAVAGYRGAALTGELVAARAALDSAGIEAELPSAVDDVPGERRELLAWAVREGVTNVVRHSGATRCRVLLDRSGVEITDDGRGPAPEDGEGVLTGNGLTGLRERADAVGATLAVGRSGDGGFRLRVGW